MYYPAQLAFVNNHLLLVCISQLLILFTLPYPLKQDTRNNLAKADSISSSDKIYTTAFLIPIFVASDDSVSPTMTLKARITDPEVVFVANLTKADAPALTASFLCDFSLSTSKEQQMMEASVTDLKVLACPFLREKRGKNITTVRITLYFKLRLKMAGMVDFIEY